MRKKKSGGILDLRKRLPVVEIHTEALFSYANKHWHVFAKAAGLVVLVVSFGAFFRGAANVSTFYPNNCLGGWDNPSLASGEPSLEDGTPHEKYNHTNSAFIQSSSASIYCGEFGGNIPDETLAKSFKLSFHWSVGDTSNLRDPFDLFNSTGLHPAGDVDAIEVIEVESSAAQEQSIDDLLTEDDSEEKEPAESEVKSINKNSQQPDNALPEAKEENPANANGIDDSQNPTPEVVEESSTETVNAAEDQSATPEPAPEPDPIPTPEPAEPAPEPAAAPVEESPQAFLKSRLQKIFSPQVFAQEGGEPAPEPAPEPVLQVVEVVEDEPESTPAPEVEVAPEPEVSLEPDVAGLETSPVVETIAEDFPASESQETNTSFLEVRYTKNGIDWESLGFVDRNDWQNSTFDIPLSDWQDLSGFQVELRTLSSLDTPPVIYLDAMELSVEYEGVEQYEELPTVEISGDDFNIVSSDEKSFGSQETIVFDLDTPDLSFSEIEQLVKDGRANIVSDPNNVLSKKLRQPDRPYSVDVNTQPEEKPIELNSIIEKIFGEETPAPIDASGVVVVPESAPEETIDAKTEKSDKPNFLEDVLNNLTSYIYVKNALAGNGAKIVDTQVVDNTGAATSIAAKIKKVNVGGQVKETVVVDKPDRQFRPGKYTLRVTVLANKAKVVFSQDFTWGVLAINTDKSVYHPGDVSYLQMGVLDDNGDTICDADLHMTIVSPLGNISVLDTSDGSIVREPQCGHNNIISVPDYYANYASTNEFGIYSITLTADTYNGTRTISDAFEVKQNTLFDVRRTGPTRIFVEASYPVSLYITANSNWSGDIIDYVPSSFDVLPPKHSLVYDSVDISPSDPGTKTITWKNVNLIAGQTVALGYYFKAPPISPEFYLLGPLSFYINNSQKQWQESRKWQIAADPPMAAMVQTHFKIYQDDAGLNAATQYAAEDTNFNVAENTLFRIRLQLSNLTPINYIAHRRLMFSEDGGTYTQITTGTNNVRLADSSNFSDGDATTTRLSSPGGSFTAGEGKDTSSDTASPGLIASKYTEDEWGLKFEAAAVGHSYAFRIYQDSGAPITSYTVTPVISPVSAGITISGTSDASDGTTVRVAVNSTLQAETTTVSSGAWAITGVSTPSAGDTITVWLDGVADANEATGVTKYASGDVATMYLNAGFLSIGSDQNTSLAITNLGQYDADDDEDIMHTANSGTLLTEGASNSYSGETLWITSSNTLTVDTSETVTSEHIRVNGTLTSSGNSTYNLTGTSGTLFYNLGTWTQSTSTVNVTSASGTPTLLSGATTFHKLTINAGATVINQGANITMSNADSSNKLYVQTGVLNMEGRSITGTTNGTLQVDAGAALCIGGTTSATNATCDSGATANLASTFPSNYTNGNITLSATSTVYYNNDADENLTISSVPTYGNLTFRPVTTETGIHFVANGALNINGNFSMTPDLSAGEDLIFDAGGTITVAAGKTTSISPSGGGGSMTYDLRPSSTDYDLSTGFLTIGTSGNLDGTSYSGTITLTGTSGTLFTKTGGFTQGTSEVIVTGAGSTTLLSAGTTFHRLTINNSSNTVGAGAVITMSNASSSNRLYIQSGNLDDEGNTIVGTTNGTLVMDSGTTLYLGSSGTATTFPTLYTNGNISLNANSTVVYQSGQDQAVSAVPTYGHLTITPLANTPTMTVGSATSVAGNFLSNVPANLNNTGGITVTGAGTATVYDNDNLVPGAITTNGGAILINSDRDGSSAGYITIADNLTSNGGNITIGGGSGTISSGSGFAVGDTGQGSGVYINNSAVAAGGGNIIINAQGFDTTAGSNYGLYVFNSSGAVTTTGTGTIDITGNGGGNTNSGSNYGVYVVSGAVISVVNGNLTVHNSTGGGAGSGTNNYGVYISGTNSSIKSTGSGNVSVTGSGGNSTGSGASQHGIYCQSADCITSSSTGTITVNGTGGGSSGAGNYGIQIFSPGSITAAGASITVTGTGGDSSGNTNYGVYLTGASAAITNTGTGTIDITSNGGGKTNSNNNHGLYLFNGATISTVNGNLTVDTATGGGAGSGFSNYGIYINTSSSAIKTTGSGNIDVTAVGGNSTGTGSSNYGMRCETPSCINATGTGAITITVTGGGANTSGSNQGLYMTTANASITGNGGAMIITGNGGGGSGSSNAGVYVGGTSISISNTGSGAIDIIGNGAGTTNSGTNYGVYLASGASMSVVNGDLTVVGTAGGSGSGAGNSGVYVFGASFLSTGTGDIDITGIGGNPSGTGGSNYGITCAGGTSCVNASSTGNITMSGTGGNNSGGSGTNNFGIYLSASSGGGDITGAGGVMDITGIGGGSSGNTNRGIYIDNSTISNTGSGTLLVTGTGGGITNSSTNAGLQVITGGVVSTVNGDLTIVATGGGAGTGTNNYAISVSGTGGTVKTTGSGDLIVTGIRGGGSTSSNYGCRVAVANGFQTTGSGNIIINADTFNLAQADDINSVADLTIRPYTASRTIGLGSGTGDLALSDAYLGYLTWGTSNTLTIGSTSSGDIEVNTASTILNQSVALLTGGSITLVTTDFAHAGATAATLNVLAYEDILMSANITAATSALTVNLHSDYDGNGSGTLDITEGIASNGGTITVLGGNATNSTLETIENLTINIPSKTFGLTANLNITDGLTVTAGTLDTRPSAIDYDISAGSISIGASGTIDASSSASDITVSTDWSNAGTFTAGSSTVTFNTGNTSTIGGGPTTFNNLTITHTAAKEVDFSTTASHIIHVTGAFTVTGTDSNLIKLYSTSAGTKWHFHPTGTADVDYADVKDGGCESGAISINTTNSTDSGNNESCWVFYVPTISFSLGSNSVGLGTIGTGSAGTGSHTISAASNAPGGFIITYIGALLTNQINGSYTIPAYSSSASSPGTAGFGLNLKDNATPDVGAEPVANSGTCSVNSGYGTADAFTYVASTTTTIANTSGSPADCVYTASYVGNISSITGAGDYSTTITYIVTGTF